MRTLEKGFKRGPDIGNFRKLDSLCSGLNPPPSYLNHFQMPEHQYITGFWADFLYTS